MVYMRPNIMYYTALFKATKRLRALRLPPSFRSPMRGGLPGVLTARGRELRGLTSRAAVEPRPPKAFVLLNIYICVCMYFG